jgi:hypothetical protein
VDISESDWAALAAIKTGKLPAKAVIQRLSEIKYVMTTPRGELRVTGLGNDALTLHKHGFRAPIEVDSEADEAEEEAVEESDDAIAADEDVPPDEETPDVGLKD